MREPRSHTALGRVAGFADDGLDDLLLEYAEGLPRRDVRDAMLLVRLSTPGSRPAQPARFDGGPQQVG
jgi:hypothetical protein